MCSDGVVYLWSCVWGGVMELWSCGVMYLWSD